MERHVLTPERVLRPLGDAFESLAVPGAQGQDHAVALALGVADAAVTGVHHAALGRDEAVAPLGP